MKRRPPILLILLLLLLVGGAIVNVAVAWGCAYWLEVDSGWEPTTDPIATSLESVPVPHKWSVLVRRQVGAMKVVSVRREADSSVLPLTDTDPDSLLPQWAKLSNPGVNLGEGGVFRGEGRVFEIYGWPARALVGGYEFRFYGTGASGYDSMRIIDAIELASANRRFSFWFLPSVVFIPVRPIWLAFALNTLFYAAILWLLFAAPFALRRRRRIKRCLCPKCGYPVGTSDKCTECGRASR